MADFRAEKSLGARIQSARRARGMRTTKDLADAIVGGNVTVSIIENIEAGRKVNVDISQVLNIAMALDVAPSYLLAPLGRPKDDVDLPNLSEAFAGMTALEFDSWLAGLPASGHQPRSVDERNSTTELQALREWAALIREIERLEIVLELEEASAGALAGRTASRLSSAREERDGLHAYLRSAGWDI